LVLGLHEGAAAIYLLAALAAVLGVSLRSPRWLAGAALGLGAGALVHGFAFWELHELSNPPALTELPFALSLMAWLAVLVYLPLQLRPRMRGLAVLVAPAAFLGAFAGSLAVPGDVGAAQVASPLWSHLHVLLASAGLALLGLAGAAGVLYLIQHHLIKAKRRDAPRSALPSLESLDRLNTIALASGFLLLSLGLLSGVLWVWKVQGRFWAGGGHADAAVVAWVVYAGVVFARFGVRLGARQVAIGSAAGFAILLVAVIGTGVRS
jgi:ABC-type uncharacterized transport system permease subunit